ncbi:MAG: hypothetical protein GY835_05735 [bacterium]|nr:hypothetical protein [bacterium]
MIFPATPKVATITIKSFEPNLVSITHSLKRQVRSRGGHLWQLDLGWRPQLRATFAPIAAFAVRMRGQYGVFDYVPPNVAPLGIATGAPTIDGTGQSGRELETEGWTPTTTGILKAGDYLKIAGHTKVYMVVEDTASDELGKATLTIEPALQAVPNDGEALTVHDVPFHVAFADDVVEISTDKAGFIAYGARMVEVV